MERLTEYVTENCSKPFYRFRSDGEIDIRYRYCINIEKAINKLAEYENLGDLDFLKELVNAYNNELNESAIIDYLKTIKQLNHDLKVNKMALKIANKEWDKIYVDRLVDLSKTFNIKINCDETSYFSDYNIEDKIKQQVYQAEKELKGEK